MQMREGRGRCSEASETLVCTLFPCGQVAGDKGVLELSDFVIPVHEGAGSYRLRDAAFLAELDIAVTQRTTEHRVRFGLLTAGDTRCGVTLLFTCPQPAAQDWSCMSSWCQVQ